MAESIREPRKHSQKPESASDAIRSVCSAGAPSAAWRFTNVVAQAAMENSSGA